VTDGVSYKTPNTAAVPSHNIGLLTTMKNITAIQPAMTLMCRNTLNG
jgi:hypothetical protein